MRITFNYPDLKITESECLQILDENSNTAEEFELELSRDGNYRIMVVGYTKNAKLCEVGVEFFEHNKIIFHIHIFHGMQATKQYRLLYSKRK
jgi:hypothetical protein